MSSNSLYILASVVVGIGVIFAGMKWVLGSVYKRGGTEREYKIALDANTESNKQLTGVVTQVVDKLNDQDKRIDHLDWRVERLEAAPSVNVSVTPHRDPSPAVGH